MVGPPAVCQNIDGRLQVFANFTDAALRWTVQVQKNKDFGPWNLLAGPVSSTPGVGTPAAMLNGDGRMEVYFTSIGDELRRYWQVAPGSDIWAGPDSLGGKMASSPVASRNRDSRLEVFHIGLTESIYNKWQLSPGGAWLNGGGIWNDLEVKVSGPRLCVGRNMDLRLEVFAISSTGDMWHTWQKAPSHGPWGSENIGGATLGGLGVALKELGFVAGWYFREP
jgi:hypothetical protein